MDDIDKLRTIAIWSNSQIESWWDGVDIPTILKVYEAVINTDGVEAIEDSPTALKLLAERESKQATVKNYYANNR